MTTNITGGQLVFSPNTFLSRGLNLADISDMNAAQVNLGLTGVLSFGTGLTGSTTFSPVSSSQVVRVDPQVFVPFTSSGSGAVSISGGLALGTAPVPTGSTYGAGSTGAGSIAASGSLFLGTYASQPVVPTGITGNLSASGLAQFDSDIFLAGRLLKLGTPGDPTTTRSMLDTDGSFSCSKLTIPYGYATPVIDTARNVKATSLLSSGLITGQSGLSITGATQLNGAVAASSISTTGGGSITTTGTIDASGASGLITTTTFGAGRSAGGNSILGISAAGALTSTAPISGSALSATGAVSGASITASGLVQGATITSTGVLNGASASITNQLSCGSLNIPNLTSWSRMYLPYGNLGGVSPGNIGAVAIFASQVNSPNIIPPSGITYSTIAHSSQSYCDLGLTINDTLNGLYYVSMSMKGYDPSGSGISLSCFSLCVARSGGGGGLYPLSGITATTGTSDGIWSGVLSLATGDYLTLSYQRPANSPNENWVCPKIYFSGYKIISQ